MKEVVVLRIGHRPQRDKRVTTHLALVARAFGAHKFILDNSDEKVERSIKGVLKKFGGDMEFINGANWKDVIKNFEGVKIHLTMYGLPIDDIIDEIRKYEKILVIVGAEKVPAELYRLADYNISIGNQPHSEVSALAIFLDRYYQGSELRRKIYGHWRIIPSARGKRVLVIPTEEDCLRILREVGCSESVIRHCITVKEIAVQIAKMCKKEVDLPLIVAGALLHDIGRSVTHSILHVVEGSKIARRLGLPEELVNIIERHVSAGIPKEEAVRLGLGFKDFIPVTLEEMIVCYADKLADVNRVKNYSEILEEFRKTIPEAADRLANLRKKICEECEVDDI